MPRPGVDIIDSVPFEASWTPPLQTTGSDIINTAAMNQGLESDCDDAHQTLKYTKAKMRKILARIEASQEDHGQPLDTRVSIV